MSLKKARIHLCKNFMFYRAINTRNLKNTLTTFFWVIPQKTAYEMILFISIESFLKEQTRIVLNVTAKDQTLANQ